MKAKIKKEILEHNLAAPADGLLLCNSKTFRARYTDEGQLQVYYYKWRYVYSYDFDLIFDTEKENKMKNKFRTMLNYFTPIGWWMIVATTATIILGLWFWL